MYVQRNIEARPCNHSCSGKAISITHSECVFVALSIQRACAILSSVACPAHNIFSHYLINCTICENKILFNIKCVF